MQPECGKKQKKRRTLATHDNPRERAPLNSTRPTLPFGERGPSSCFSGFKSFAAQVRDFVVKQILDARTSISIVDAASTPQVMSPKECEYDDKSSIDYMASLTRFSIIFPARWWQPSQEKMIISNAERQLAASTATAHRQLKLEAHRR